MNLLIEKAQEKDIEKVGMLYNDVCDYLADKEYNPGWRKGYFPSEAEAEAFWKKDGLYIAVADGRVAGSVAVTHSPDGEADEEVGNLPDGAKSECLEFLFIHVLAVHPNFLQKYIGSKLLRFAEELGRQKKVKAMRLYVWENNSVAIKTYEKNGYRRIGKEDIGLEEYGMKWFYLYEKSLI